MAESLQTAFLLFVVGMISVSIILLGVMALGQFIIKGVNYFHKELLNPEPHESLQENISRKKIAVMAATVHELSRGTATIDKIENYNG